jgi:hypothetical protein
MYSRNRKCYAFYLNIILVNAIAPAFMNQKIKFTELKQKMVENLVASAKI